MTCDEARRLIDLHLDQELVAERAAEMEAHLEACASCRTLADSRRRERDALRAKLQRYAAPTGLDGRVVAALDSASPGAMRRWFLGGSRVAAALVIGALLGSGITYHAVRPGREDLLAHDRLASHLRSLVSEERMIDMASSDHHTLKPWFAGKVDLSPPVVDLASAGFPLVGGRVDYIAGQRVAVLVYRHGAHVVSLFVEQGTPPAAGVRSERGYNVVGWSEGGLDLRAISDAAPGELLLFARLFREGTVSAAVAQRSLRLRRGEPGS